MLDPFSFRQGIGHLATGVTVISTKGADGRLYGLTVSSLTSLSLEPPLVQWSLKAVSYSFPIFAAAEMFAVNILASNQEQVSRDFCRPIDRFATVDWEEGLNGLPLVRGAVAWLECAREEILVGGDHRIFVGRVMRIRHFERQPLLHWRGRYVALNKVQTA
jgi:flavin reductase (DIM6/NTAB) family NADH-FMN oxidoreductase RutF